MLHELHVYRHKFTSLLKYAMVYIEIEVVEPRYKEVG